PAVTAHLNMLQGIITRMGTNSVSCKTWCLTLTSAIIGLAGATHSPAIVGFVLVPIVLFGFIDMMYLAQESAYRDLYNRVVAKVRATKYDLACSFEAEAPIRGVDVLSAIGSWAVLPVYLGLILAYFAAQSAGWIATLAQTAK